MVYDCSPLRGNYIIFKTAQGSLSSILNQNNSTGDNFADWKRNLLIVLSFEKYKYVLEKDCPHIPKENASSEESMVFDNWVNSNEIARCYMMASMNSVLQKQHEGFLNARDIMHNIEDMFGGQFVLVHQAVILNLMNCKHKPETPIKDHILTVIGYLAEAQSHGSEIDADTQMEMIFKSLLLFAKTNLISVVDGWKIISNLRCTHCLTPKLIIILKD
ncbi:hypothetical protein UlMin_035129 [Ulmus minor]